MSLLNSLKRMLAATSVDELASIDAFEISDPTIDKPTSRLAPVTGEIHPHIDIIRGQRRYHNHVLDELASRTPLPAYVTVVLIREPENKNDPHAIRAEVRRDKSNGKIGYVAREVATHLSASMDRHDVERFDVLGVLLGSPDWAEIDVCPYQLITRGPLIETQRRFQRKSAPGSAAASEAQVSYILSLLDAVASTRSGAKQARELIGFDNIHERRSYRGLTQRDASRIIDGLKAL